MALSWDFKEKAGNVTQVLRDGTERTNHFYVGNAFMIVPYEYKERGKDYYTMDWFFHDKEHAKRCLGLAKMRGESEPENIFGEGNITQITIYRDNCKLWKTIVDLFTRAFPDIRVTILGRAPEPAEKPADEPADKGGDA